MLPKKAEIFLVFKIWIVWKSFFSFNMSRHSKNPSADSTQLAVESKTKHTRRKVFVATSNEFQSKCACASWLNVHFNVLKTKRTIDSHLAMGSVALFFFPLSFFLLFWFPSKFIFTVCDYLFNDRQKVPIWYCFTWISTKTTHSKIVFVQRA